MGHRNRHGLAVNPETGDLWETEQGPSGGDEMNVLGAGKNYGRPVVKYDVLHRRSISACCMC